MEQNIAAAQVEEVIRHSAGDLLVDLQLFDVYQGEQVANQRKSLAYSLVLQSRERTLLDAEITDIIGKVINELQMQLGAKLR